MTATIHPLRKNSPQLQCQQCGTSQDAACDCGVGYMPVKASEAAAKAIAANPFASNRVIAEKLGVNKDTVRVARNQLAENSPVERRTGKDGKTRKMPEPKAKPKAKPKPKPKSSPPPPDIYQEPCVDCNSEEENWQWSLGMFAGEAISMRAFWTRQFGKWQSFEVPPESIALAEQAAASWQQLVIDLKKRRTK